MMASHVAPSIVIPPRKASVGAADKPNFLQTSATVPSPPLRVQLPVSSRDERPSTTTTTSTHFQAIPMRSTSHKKRLMVQEPGDVLPYSQQHTRVQVPSRGQSTSRRGIEAHATESAPARSHPPQCKQSTVPPIVQPRRSNYDDRLPRSHSIKNLSEGQQHQPYTDVRPTQQRVGVSAPVIIAKRTTSKKANSANGRNKQTHYEESISYSHVERSNSDNSLGSSYFDVVETAHSIHSLINAYTDTLSLPRRSPAAVQIPTRAKQYPESSILDPAALERAFNARFTVNSLGSVRRAGARSRSVDTNPLSVSVYSSTGAAEDLRESVADLQEHILSRLRQSLVQDLRESLYTGGYTTYTGAEEAEGVDEVAGTSEVESSVAMVPSRDTLLPSRSRASTRIPLKNLVIPRRGDSHAESPVTFAPLHGEAGTSEDTYDAVMDHVLEFMNDMDDLASPLDPATPIVLESERTSASSFLSGKVVMGAFQLDLMKKLRVVKKMMEDSKRNAAARGSDLFGSRGRKGSVDTTGSDFGMRPRFLQLPKRF
ncbi:hypothetical protein BC830DRAFT_258663 [Chytriomyces sp. MP71]|nr:hypothetical protein BC830DRAFT_258663 [Chytriomyces sp. MP71]